MADTQKYKTKIEPYVRRWLTKKFNKSFKKEETELRLRSGGRHRFDAVSKDRKIVAGIRSSVGRKHQWGEGGKIKATYTKILFLSQVRAQKRLLVFTDKLFFEKFKKRSEFKYPKTVELIYCPLSRVLKRIATGSYKKSSREIGKK